MDVYKSRNPQAVPRTQGFKISLVLFLLSPHPALLLILDGVQCRVFDVYQPLRLRPQPYGVCGSAISALRGLRSFHSVISALRGIRSLSARDLSLTGLAILSLSSPAHLLAQKSTGLLPWGIRPFNFSASTLRGLRRFLCLSLTGLATGSNFSASTLRGLRLFRCLSLTGLATFPEVKLHIERAGGAHYLSKGGKMSLNAR